MKTRFEKVDSHAPAVIHAVKPKRSVRALIALGLATVALAARAQTVLPAGFVGEVVIPASAGLYGPTALAFVGSDRMFIAQKDGQVRVWQNGALLATPFIDLSAEVNSYYDRGLLGLAIHPNFPSTPYVYLLYTYDPPTVTPDGTGARVSRLLRVTADSANPNVASTAAGSRVVLLGTNSIAANIGDPNVNNNFSAPSCQFGTTYLRDCIPSDGASHSIGTVAFGPDGSLYAGSGDSADFDFVDRRALRTLDVDSLSGKIMRINPMTGQGYSDNPFYDGDLDSNRSKVLNLGLRNPFRFTIHPNTGMVYIGDVG
jgi:glucose/arabinose dehydrogenase